MFVNNIAKTTENEVLKLYIPTADELNYRRFLIGDEDTIGVVNDHIMGCSVREISE